MMNDPIYRDFWNHGYKYVNIRKTGKMEDKNDL